MVILTNNGFVALLRHIHNRLPKSGGIIDGNLTVNNDFEVKGHATEQLASFPGLNDNFKPGQSVTITTTRLF